MEKSNKSIIIFDGICLLCNQAVYFLHKKLRYQHYKFIASQSDDGEAYINKYNLHAISKQSIVLLKNSNIYTKSEAILQIIDDMPRTWQLLKVMKVVPKNIRNWLYDLVSRYRYLIFGKSS